MQQVVFINDSMPMGKLLITLLKEFESPKKRGKVVKFFTETELEEMEDEIFLKMMEADRKSGKTDTKRVLKKLGIK